MATGNVTLGKRKRGPYRLYNKDSSIPIPKVSFWRRKNEVEAAITKDDTTCSSASTSECDDEELLTYLQGRKQSVLIPLSNSSGLEPATFNNEEVNSSLEESPLDMSNSSSDNSIFNESTNSSLSLNHESFTNLCDESYNESHFNDTAQESCQSESRLSFEESSACIYLNSTFDESVHNESTNNISDVSIDLLSYSIRNHEESQVSSESDDQPLYASSSLTKEESWREIMQFCVENNLTYSASESLLSLLRKHCPENNLLPKSLHSLRKRFEQHDTMEKRFCSSCYDEIPVKGKCPKYQCISTKAELCQFIELNFAEDLKHIYEVYWDKLQYPFIRKSTEGTLADIQDGHVIKSLMRPGQFLSSPEHAALVLNTDGVQAFNSCKHSIWPVFLMITNLPPEIRMNERNIILAAVWFGPCKPKDMSIILTPAINSIKTLSTEGIIANTPAGPKRVKAMIVAAVFDLVAKAPILNTIQFNGYYGCVFCKDKGQSIDRRHVYPPTDRHEMRTEQDMLKWANEAQSTGKVVYGVKGFSVLANIVNIPFGVPIDYMHAVLEGVVKTLMVYWFKKSNMPYSLKQYITAIDKEMIQIKPPHEFRRSPRTLESFTYWKASEFRVFLLFYAVPLLKQYLPSDYTMHLSILVFALHRLLSTTIQFSELPMIKEALDLFYEMIPQLYGLHMCTANVHSLCHLVTMVHYWGPLWSYSAFGFESVNGVLKRQIHGTRQVLYQAVSSMKLRRTLSFVKKNDSIPDNIIVGKSHNTVVSQEYAQVIGSTNVLAFYRAKINHVVYYSKKHERQDAARISSIVSIIDNGTLYFGQIVFFFVDDDVKLLLEKYEFLNEGVLSDVANHASSVLQCKRSILDKVIFKVKKLSVSKTIEVVSIKNVSSKCILIPVSGEDWDFISLLPNLLERH